MYENKTTLVLFLFFCNSFTIQILSLSDIGCEEEIPETATTIEGNAILKANYVTEKYGYDCFADDTGLEVEALNGEPGVFSARHAGEQRNSEDNMDKLLANLQNQSNRKAQFKTVIALNLNGEQHLFTGIAKGEITSDKHGIKGFLSSKKVQLAIVARQLDF